MLWKPNNKRKQFLNESTLEKDNFDFRKKKRTTLKEFL
jgi:hypothetical protein